MVKISSRICSDFKGQLVMDVRFWPISACREGQQTTRSGLALRRFGCEGILETADRPLMASSYWENGQLTFSPFFCVDLKGSVCLYGVGESLHSCHPLLQQLDALNYDHVVWCET